MDLAVLFSGGKDSAMAAFIAVKHGHNISCLVSIESENPASFMFHTPAITHCAKQAEQMGIPLVVQKTEGRKEAELQDLKKALILAMEKYRIEGVVTGAIASVYQASRIQRICNGLGLECFNPLWMRDQKEVLLDLLRNRFCVIVTSVSAYPLGKGFIGRLIDRGFVSEMEKLSRRYGINPAGEGGEYETFVLKSPMFRRGLKARITGIKGSGYDYRMEAEIA